MGCAVGPRRAALSRTDHLSLQPLALLSRQADARRIRFPRSGRRARGDRRAAAHRKGRVARLAHARRADRRASDRGGRRDRAHLFDQRHDRDAELHSPHRRRSRGLGAHLRALLRGLRRRARRTHRLDLQRRAFRRRRRARRLRPARPLPYSGRLGKHRAADDRGRPAQAQRRRDDAVLRAASRRMGAGARHGPRQVEREAGDGRGRARRGRTRHARQARGGLGRERHRGDGHRRHFGFPLGRVRGKGRHAFRRPRLRAF